MTRIQSGFTLIELLVTVSILTILASLAISNTTEYRARVYDVEAMTTARNIYTSLEMAYNDLQALEPTSLVSLGCNYFPKIPPRVCDAPFSSLDISRYPPEKIFSSEMYVSFSIQHQPGNIANDHIAVNVMHCKGNNTYTVQRTGNSGARQTIESALSSSSGYAWHFLKLGMCNSYKR